MSHGSEQLGNSTSAVEVPNISPQGLGLWLGDREPFEAFSEFAWFENAPVGKTLNEERPRQDHLYWPELDVDLSVRSDEHPEELPLRSRAD